MFTTLNTKISSTLASVTELAVVYDRPLAQGEVFTGYPAAVFYYTGLRNSFETNQENLKEYLYTIVLVTETQVKGMDAAHGTVMAGLLDAVMEKFDANWDQGASSEGHRIWWKADDVTMGIFEEHTGLLISATINLTIKVITND